ncbi:unnamed protein product [Arctogadus glacialis]
MNFDSEPFQLETPCRVLRGSLSTDSSCRRQPASGYTGTVYWNPAPRCFNQVSERRERDLSHSPTGGEEPSQALSSHFFPFSPFSGNRRRGSSSCVFLSGTKIFGVPHKNHNA